MDSWKAKVLGLAAAAGLALLASCDNGPSAVETRDRTAEAAGAYGAPAERGYARDPGAGGDGGGERRAERRAANDDVPQVDGRPLWSSNRRYSAAQNAAYHYRRNGKDFGARSQDEYVRKAHAFIDSPPRGTLRLTRRNGDRLLYDPAANVFAVATKDGAPRTMFKPEDGMAYWERQKTREQSGGPPNASRSRRDGDGEQG